MSYLSEQNADTPLSRWQFEETSGTTIDDDQSTTRDGTINGGVTLNQSAVFQDGGLGATFDGTSGYISMSNMSGLLGIGTIEAVVQFSAIPASTTSPLFAHAWTTGQILPLVIGFNLDASHAGKLQVGYYPGSGSWQTATWTTAPSTGVPYHIVGTYDGTTLKLYVNNSLVASSTPGTARPGAGSVNASGYLGRRWDTAEYLNGKLWDVALYGAALSSTRVAVHYTQLANPIADNFANAGILTSPLSLAGVDTTSWTTEGSEPGGLFNTGWAQYTPASSARFSFDTIGSNYDTVINVYTGASLGSLTLVGSDDDSGGSGTSLLQLNLTSGTTYYVQVGAKAAGGGSLYFNFSQRSTAELGAISAEALSDASPIRRLAAISAESLTDSASIPSRQLGAISAEAITDSATPPKRQLAAVTVEVLVPSKLGYVGWGTPIKSLSWS